MSVDTPVGVEEQQPCDHDWQLVELQVVRSGLDRRMVCARCDEEAYEVRQATRRPAL